MWVSARKFALHGKQTNNFVPEKSLFQWRNVIWLIPSSFQLLYYQNTRTVQEEAFRSQHETLSISYQFGHYFTSIKFRTITLSNFFNLWYTWLNMQCLAKDLMKQIFPTNLCVIYWTFMWQTNIALMWSKKTKKSQLTLIPLMKYSTTNCLWKSPNK